MLDFDTAGRALLSAEYVYAKTMPQCPHWYTLRNTWADHDLFEQVVQFIRDHGYREKFGWSWYTRLDVNGMKYWSMGAPLPKTILINRAVIEREEPYDAAAHVYDGIFADPEALAEERAVMAALAYRGGSILDVGCGTGMLLRYLRPDQYLGIEPSRQMLAKLLRDHPGAETINTAMRSFIPPSDRGYDLVTALFGTASYLTGEEVDRARSMVAPGGRWAFMFFAPGYEPVTHIETGIRPPVYEHDIARLRPENVVRIGNFNLALGSAEALAA